MMNDVLETYKDEYLRNADDYNFTMSAVLGYPGHSYRGDLKVGRGEFLSSLLTPHLHQEAHKSEEAQGQHMLHSDLEQEGDQHHVIHQPHL